MVLAGTRWSGSEWPTVNVPSPAPASSPPHPDSPSDAASTTAATPATVLRTPLWLVMLLLGPVTPWRRGRLAARRT
ncbi:hypothetical protein GCM10009735_69350 [Actinomadura chokoriensis]